MLTKKKTLKVIDAFIRETEWGLDAIPDGTQLEPEEAYDVAFNEGMLAAYENVENFLTDTVFREIVIDILKKDGWLT